MKVVGTIRCVLHAYCCSLKCCLKSSRDVTFNDPYCHCLYTFVLYPYLPLQFYSIVFYYYFQFVTCNMTQACSNVKLVILEGKREWKCPYIVSLAVNCVSHSVWLNSYYIGIFNAFFRSFCELLLVSDSNSP